jgi:WS/DGAT/MGAT family acyltransferase
VDRLSALDQGFLDLETSTAPLHVGWTIRLEGPAPPVAALRRHLDARLAAVPRFRRSIQRPALGDPHWVDDPSFDIARHVHGVTLPAPGGAGELRDTAGALLSTPLEPHRPLWRLYLVDGLADGGWAVVGQAHHALVDGIAAVEVATLLFDVAGARTPPPPPTRWTPERSPGAGASAAAAGANRARATAGAARALVRALGARQVGDGVRSVARTLEALAGPAPGTALDRSITRERRVAFATASLDDARMAGRRHGATVNDVLLAASSMALRHALHRRGDTTPSVKALVPVSTREGDAGELGNRVSFVTVDLPVGCADPSRALRLIASRTKAVKASGQAEPLDGLARSADALPAAARRLLVRGAARVASFNTVVSNVPGPPVGLELIGRAVLAIHPMIPLLEGHGLTIGALSYGGRLHLGVTTDAKVAPDAVEIARDLESAFDALRHEPAPEPPPWRARARARRDAAAQRGANR